jgi:hypothetical protein
MTCAAVSWALMRDPPPHWPDPAVIDHERKEILAQLVDDVSFLSERAEITVHVPFAWWRLPQPNADTVHHRAVQSHAA